jgi:tripartite-type tricarboxylate transporter receptor subunit TctC
MVEDWTGFAVKRGTPPAVVAQLNAAINKALGKPAVREAFAKLGVEAVGGTPAQYGSLVSEQIAHWKKVVTGAR